MDIFLDDMDRSKFLDSMFHFSKETGIRVVAWCLMRNHVHMLLFSDSIPDVLMKKIGCSYVKYYNLKYNRVGHLFQNRYFSRAITSEHYLLCVARYIHKNPEKAFICRMENYKWSSYQDYMKGNNRTYLTPILSILSGIQGFEIFMAADDKEDMDTAVYIDHVQRLTEKEAILQVVNQIPDYATQIKYADKTIKKAIINQMFSMGLTGAQICRITGMNKSNVYRARNKSM